MEGDDEGPLGSALEMQEQLSSGCVPLPCGHHLLTGSPGWDCSWGTLLVSSLHSPRGRHAPGHLLATVHHGVRSEAHGVPRHLPPPGAAGGEGPTSNSVDGRLMHGL